MDRTDGPPRASGESALTSSAATAPPSDQGARRWIGIAISVAAVLTCIKILTSLLTRSLGIGASALDSASDVLMSSVNFWSLRFSQRPADDDHAYGHEKVEGLVGLLQGLLIAGGAVAMAVASVHRLVRGVALDRLDVGVAVMVVSAVVSWWLSARLQRVAQRSGLVIVAAERVHYASDALANAGVLATLLLVRRTGLTLWDPIISLAVTLWILRSAWSVLRTSVDQLMDRALPDEQVALIKRTILTHDARIVDFHSLRTRRAGNHHFIDVHIVIRGEEDFKRAHAISESLILALQQHIPGVDCTVHYDPEGES